MPEDATRSRSRSTCTTCGTGRRQVVGTRQRCAVDEVRGERVAGDGAAGEPGGGGCRPSGRRNVRTASTRRVAPRPAGRPSLSKMFERTFSTRTHVITIAPAIPGSGAGAMARGTVAHAGSVDPAGGPFGAVGAGGDDAGSTAEPPAAPAARRRRTRPPRRPGPSAGAGTFGRFGQQRGGQPHLHVLDSTRAATSGWAADVQGSLHPLVGVAGGAGCRRRRVRGKLRTWVRARPRSALGRDLHTRVREQAGRGRQQQDAVFGDRHRSSGARGGQAGW